MSENQSNNNRANTYKRETTEILLLIKANYERETNFSEISRKLNIPLGTVKSIVRRFRISGSWDPKPKGGCKNQKFTAEMKEL